jgi:hypothetical protein
MGVWLRFLYGHYQMKHNGFTLLEVLVAGFILFISLSAATLVFTSSNKSSASATSAAKISVYSSLIRDDIKISLTGDDKINSGSGSFMDINYRWLAKIEESKDAVSMLPEDAGSEDLLQKITLWNVDMVLSLDDKEHDYQFFVTSW